MLPIVLATFSASEVTIWLLVSSIGAFQLVFDAGFTPTFTRLISYVSGSSPDQARLRETGLLPATASSVEDVRAALLSSLQRVFRRLSAISAVLVVTLGTLAAFRQLQGLENPAVGYAVLWLLGPTWAIEMYGRRYVSFLEGTGRLPIIRRWKGVFGVSVAITNLLALLLGGRLLALALSGHVWRWLNVLWNRRLYAKALEESSATGWTVGNPSPEVTKAVEATVWSRGWRAGVGVALGYGSVSGTGIIYAQIGSPAAVGSYLLALRLLEVMKGLAQAPFYAQLPEFGSMYADGDTDRLGRSMLARMLAVIGLLFLGSMTFALAGQPLLRLLGSSTEFVALRVWALLCIATIAERISAMQLQGYTLTNRVVWHKVNGAHGGAAVILSLIFGSLYFDIGFAAALAAANVLVFLPWTATLNSRIIGWSRTRVVLLSFAAAVIILTLAAIFLPG